MTLDAALIGPHLDADPDDDESDVMWDWAGGFVDENTVIASTEESNSGWGEIRPWPSRYSPSDSETAHGAPFQTPTARCTCGRSKAKTCGKTIDPRIRLRDRMTQYTEGARPLAP